jgi:hypothetical protein
MAAVTFSTELQEGNSLTMPTDAVDELGLRTGEPVRVYVERLNGTVPEEAPDQDELNARFEEFLEKVHSTKIEKPTKYYGRTPAKRAFSEAMDEKYRKMGFKL